MCASASRDWGAGFGWFGVSMGTTSMARSIPYRIASSFYRFRGNRDIGDTPGAPARGVGDSHFTQAVSRQARTRRGRSSVFARPSPRRMVPSTGVVRRCKRVFYEPASDELLPRTESRPVAGTVPETGRSGAPVGVAVSSKRAFSAGIQHHPNNSFDEFPEVRYAHAA